MWGISWQPSQAPSCQRSHGRGLQRQLCPGKVPSNSVFSLQQQNIKLFFSRNLPKGLGSWQQKSWKRKILVPLWRRGLRAHWRLWFSGQAWCVEEELDLSKAALCKCPSCKWKGSPGTVQFVVSLSSLGTGWEWGCLQIWCQDRQGYVRTGSLQLLSILRWSSHSHPTYRCHHPTTNFPARLKCFKHT